MIAGNNNYLSLLSKYEHFCLFTYALRTVQTADYCLIFRRSLHTNRSEWNIEMNDEWNISSWRKWKINSLKQVNTKRAENVVILWCHWTVDTWKWREKKFIEIGTRTIVDAALENTNQASTAHEVMERILLNYIKSNLIRFVHLRWIRTMCMFGLLFVDGFILT